MKLALVFLALASSVVGLPANATKTYDDCETRCIESMTPCGQRWGGCWNPCIQNAPREPRCSLQMTQSPYQPLTTNLKDCRTRTVCIDAVNECGIWYGGCFPDCKPLPLTKPPCPTITSTKYVGVTTTSVPEVTTTSIPEVETTSVSVATTTS